MRIKRREKTINIPHPSDPSFIVTVKRRKRVESLRDFEGVLNAQKMQVLVHPETKEVLKDDKGEPITRTTNAFSVDSIKDSLEKIIEGWKGYEEEDEDGNVVDILYTKDRIDDLFEEEFDVEEIDEETEELSKIPFWQYIMRELAGGNKNGPLAKDESF